MKKIEIIGKRKPKEKHYLQDDGTFLAEMYDQNVHFLKDNHYEEIDNTLVKEDNCYVNKKNDYKIIFPLKNDTRIMRIEKDNNYIEFFVENYNDYSTVIENNPNNKLVSNICFKNVFDNIDFNYKLDSSKIKESIVINSNIFKTENLYFLIKSNLELLYEEDGSIIATDGNKIIYKFDKPFLIDNVNNENYNCMFDLEIKDGVYKLLLQIDEKWCKENTNYPIVIDPTITECTDDNSVYDTYIFPNDTNVSRGNLDYLKVGVERQNGNDIVNRALIKFDLPELGTGSQIIDAQLYLKNYPYNTSQILNEIIDIHRVTSDWTELGANWSTMGNAYDSRVEGAFNFYGWYFLNANNQPTIMTETADITYLVQKWYTDTPNYGIMLKLSKEQYNLDIVPLFFSKDFQNYTGDSPKPLLAITYRNQNGIESYMNYETHSISKCKAYHNIYNGNLCCVFDLCSTEIGKSPMNIKLIYNTNDVVLNKNKGYGIGFKLNVEQTIEEVNIDNKTYLEFVDEDGTIHYFLNQRRVEDETGHIIIKEEENTYYDEDGLDLIIKVYNDKYELIDKHNNKREFTIYNSVGYLTKIINSAGDENSIFYDSTYSKILYIFDSNNQVINFRYNYYFSNSLTISSKFQSTTLSLLDSNTLNSIVYPEEVLNIYSNQNHLIYMMNVGLRRKINYEYYSESPYKLKKVIEYGEEDEIGNYYETKYNFNSTTITDSKDRSKTIVFNKMGNAESIACLKDGSDLINAYGIKNTYGAEIGNNDFHKNKLLENNIPLKYVKNYLNNSSFENSTFDFISNQTGSLSLSSDYVNTGLQSLKINNLNNSVLKATKTIELVKGKYYTFSAYILCNMPVRLLFSYTNNNNETVEELSETLTSSDSFERIDLSTFYPSDATSDLTIGFYTNTIGYCYVDDIQLEEGEVVNNYNMIDNSDFSDGFSDWTLDSGDYNLNDIFSIVNINNSQKALKTIMYSHNGTSIEKEFNIKGLAGDKFTLAFWYKNTGLISQELFNDAPQNVVSITFIPTDTQHGGDLIENYVLNANENEWEFFIQTFTAGYDFSSFKLTFNQYLNANELYITNINLFKDVRSVKYNYDSNGNIVSKKKLNNNSDNYSYNNENLLIKMINSKNSSFYFEYDNAVDNRLLNGISDYGVSNEIEYDSSNNPINYKCINKYPMLLPREGLFNIRLKGLNKSISLINNSINIIEDSHNHCKWNIQKIVVDDKDYYKIFNSIINEKYFTENNDVLTISTYSNDNSLFELIKNENGSFSLKNKYSGKYLKYNNNNILIFDDYEKNDYNFEFYFEEKNDGIFIENSAKYTQDGKYINSIIDSTLGEKKYNFDTEKNLLLSITDEKNRIISYTYDSLKRLVSINNRNRITTYEYNINNLLSKITQKNRIFNLEYDNFQKLKKIKIGQNHFLSENNYDLNNGRLLSTTFGNNQTLYYDYDEFDRIKRLTTSDNIYNYKYDNNGELAKVISNNGVEKYTYDSSNRIYKYAFNEFKITNIFDENNNIIRKKYLLDSNIFVLNRVIENDNSVTDINYDNNDISQEFDDLGRLKRKKINNLFNIELEYYNYGKRETELVKTYSNGTDIIKYKYNKDGLITHIYYNNILQNKYYYDCFNQLIREDDFISNKTIKYFYDELGNIIIKKKCALNTDNLLSQTKYEYSNSDLPDLLTSIGNKSITYDDLGNPIVIGNDIYLTWSNGRNLNGYTDQNNELLFKYNQNGVRISKIVNNIETNYYLDGSNIIFEKTGNNVIYFIRNDKELLGFKYNENVYFYLKNNQDDIIGILDSNNNIVAKYRYDSWGNLLSVLDGSDNDVSQNSNHIANINPYRYRSYYYDKETSLYYLKTRYYNPEWGRFINPDGLVNFFDQTCGNLYSYCKNDPINLVDSEGELFEGIKKRIKNAIKKLAKTVVYIASTLCNNILGWKSTSLLVNHALKEEPEDLYFGYGSLPAETIISNKNFHEQMQEYGRSVLKNQPLSSKEIELNDNFDSFFSLHGITINPTYKGNGTFSVKVTDDYNFEYWQYKPIYDVVGNFKTFVNNVGFFLFKYQVLTEYYLTIQFDYRLDNFYEEDYDGIRGC